MIRRLLSCTLLLFACLGTVQAQQPAGDISDPAVLLTDVPVHDPVMIRQNGSYHIYCTGRGIASWSSADRIHWKREKPVFEVIPAWIMGVVPSFNNQFWAPDISFFRGKYYLFYAVSAFGKNTSAIGVATNPTLDPADPAFKWTDQGMVIRSHPGTDNWNAIDPNLIEDRDGTPYLAFGSFWSGLKLVKLSRDRLRVDQQLTNLPSIATRQKSQAEVLPSVDGNPADAGGNAIEAPFIYRKGKYFYLFASIDYCCKGPASTYKMIIGRSLTLKGPYLDEQGVSMAKGGASIVLAGDKNWYGVGHNAVCNFDGTDYLIFHAYDASDGGRSKLRIEKLAWANAWPRVLQDSSLRTGQTGGAGSPAPGSASQALPGSASQALPGSASQADTLIHSTGNPIIRHEFTADPAAMVYQGKVYLYTGHDEAPKNKTGYVMHDWRCFSTSDMVNFTEHASPLNVHTFAWAKDDAWASQVIERNGKFYWYVAVEHATIPGKAIGVAVSDSPTGPFKDARGSALITNDMTRVATHPWDDIDPTVLIDDDGQAWLFWGNGVCYYARLKSSMTELDGPIESLKLPYYTEAPWINKHAGWYYFSYASGFPEKISYAMSRSITGPWAYKGVLNELAGNSNTNHQAIIDFKGKSYFIYHNGALAADAGSFHRSVCIDYLYYNPDGTIKRIVMTSEGVSGQVSH